MRSNYGGAKHAERMLRRWLRRNAAPAIQYGVFDACGPRFTFAGGMADICEKRILTAATRLMAYSVTKTFTAAAVLTLVEKGVLALDQPVRAYLQDFPYGEQVRLRHLLAQTSGLPNPIPLRWVHAPADHGSFNETAALRRIARRHPRPAFAPGTRYGYSNLSYWYLGALVEHVSGVCFAEFMQDRIFSPLGVAPDELTFVVADPKQQAAGYLRRWSFLDLIKGFVTDRTFWGKTCNGWREILPHYPDGAAFGGLIGNVMGFGKFLTDQLRPQSLLLSAQTKALFHSPQTSCDGKPVPMTLGWHIAPTQTTQVLFKEGGGAGFHAELRLYPKIGVGSIILTNSTGFNTRRRMTELDTLFLR